YITGISIVLEIVLLSTIFGSIITLLLYAMLKYRYLKSHQPEFRLSDTFRLSLPVEKILQYRLAICRDYAKITAALLLFSYYPKNKIYFITIPSHVATAINIEDRIYVLDQHLPVLTIEKWMDVWNRRLSRSVIFKFSSLIFRLLKGGEVEMLELLINYKGNIRIKKACCQKLIGVMGVPKIDTEYLVSKIMYDIRISQNLSENTYDLKINLKNFALYYDKDEIVEFSLLRAIKNKLEKELCGNLQKIKGINITQNEADLILGVYIKR
ncbi:MAG: transglutaminase-like domain-containing protein, partial [Nitrososphaeria archaeon]